MTERSPWRCEYRRSADCTQLMLLFLQENISECKKKDKHQHRSNQNANSSTWTIQMCDMEGLMEAILIALTLA